MNNGHLTTKRDKIIALFLMAARKHERIEFSHISLFLAIYHLWQVNRFADAIPITRRKLMVLSKIRSSSTYHKCIKDFVDVGFIRYKPSYHPIGSLMYWGKCFKGLLDDLK